MSAAIRPYLAAFRIRLIMGLQYRAAAWAGVATQFSWGFMYIMIFQAFYQSAAVPPPMPFEALVSYRWLEQAFLAIVMLWLQDNELLSSITSGNIAHELTRPVGLFGFWYVRLLAQRLTAAAMRCWPILLVAFFLPAPYNLRLPPTLQAAALFFVSMTLGLLLSVAISMYIYLLTFVTLSPIGSRLIVGVAAEFLAGSVVPLPLMPERLRSALYCLPFRYTADLPFRVWSGNIQTPEALLGILIQVAWIAGLCAAGAVWMRKIQRRIVIQGG